jgi:AAA15 family ATPase/GTPase
MMASSRKSKNEPMEAVTIINNYKILSSAAIYGANASGKSNFLKAMSFMKQFIFNSSRESQFGDKIKVDGFRLNSSCDDKPSTFEMTFLVRDIDFKGRKTDVVFRYGFQVDKTKVHSEWLFGRFTAQESTLFTRFGDEIKIGEKFIEGKQIFKTVGKIRKTTLFLSLISAIKGENTTITSKIMSWFEKLIDVSTIADETIYSITANLMSEKKIKNQVRKALCLADICVEDITVKKELVDLNDLPKEILDDIKKDGDVGDLHSFSVTSQHKKYDDQKNEIGLVSFDFHEDESDGSKKFFALIGPIMDALRHGLVLLIDEIDARLHPNLCELLIALFNSKGANKKNAQLVFATHNTLIMNRKILRRDQIYFTEKNKFGESVLYSLLDYKNIRSDASYDKDYLIGKYGAIPYIGNFEAFLNEEN